MKRSNSNRNLGWAAGIMLTVACGSSCSSSGGGGDAGTRGGLCPTAFSTSSCVDGCNPCTRLTDDQVAAVVGQTAVKGMWNGDACEWDFTDAQGHPFYVSLEVGTDYATFQDLCEPSVPDSGITVTHVPGVGDDACIITTPAGGLGSFEINFLKGCFGYAVTLNGPVGMGLPFPDAMAQEFEKALALDAVPNL